MFKMELCKLFSKKRIFLILLIGIILEVILSIQMKNTMFEGFNTAVYKYYMKQLEGEYTGEKQAWVKDEYKRLKDLIDNEKEYERQYKDNKIGAEEYRTIANDVKSAKNRIYTVEYILEKSNYYAESGGNPSYYYDIEISDYIQNMNIDVILVVILMLMVLPVFTEDYSAGTVYMVESSKYGKRRLFYCRLKITIMLSVVLGFVFPVTEFITKYIRFDLGDLSADIGSLMVMGNSNMHMPVGRYLCLALVIRMFYTVVLGIISMWVANRIHNNIAAFAVISAIVFIPFFINQYMPVLARHLLICSGLGIYEVFNTYHTLCGIRTIYFSMIIYCLLIMGIIYDLHRKS